MSFRASNSMRSKYLHRTVYMSSVERNVGGVDKSRGLQRCGSFAPVPPWPRANPCGCAPPKRFGEAPRRLQKSPHPARTTSRGAQFVRAPSQRHDAFARCGASSVEGRGRGRRRVQRQWQCAVPVADSEATGSKSIGSSLGWRWPRYLSNACQAGRYVPFGYRFCAERRSGASVRRSLWRVQTRATGPPGWDGEGQVAVRRRVARPATEAAVALWAG